ncbi:SDR family oxidoreductase [Patescibacteria group bacterium]|nr:SDR family oxidoreductase [Patescibacteria group bacterium]
MAINQNLKGKCAIITGASSGIGRAAAIRLAKDGCNIYMVARRETLLKELQQEIMSLGANAEYFVGDVTDDTCAKEAVRHAHAAFGCLNIIILAAGDAFIKSFHLTSTADFHFLMDVNSFGVVNICKEAIKKMNQGGSIVLITSPAGIYGAKGMSAYALSKGGIIAFGKCLALELSSQHIRVNIISPGFVETGMTERLYGGLNEIQKKQIKEAYPLGIGQAGDVAEAIKFLVSDESSWITGVVLPVDGGFTTGI